MTAKHGRHAPRQRRRLQITRDTTLYLLGVFGFLHELLLIKDERQTVLFACLALLGLPSFLRGDEKRSKNGGHE